MFLLKLNAWYDRQEEPDRFFLFMSLISCAIVPIYIGMYLENYWAVFFGLVILGFMTCWAVVRSLHMGKIARWVAAGMVGVVAALATTIMALNLST